MKKVMSILFLTFIVVFSNGFVTYANGNVAPKQYTNYHFNKSTKSVAFSIKTISNTYTIDLKKWGIYNNGTHPTETTKGINDALIWANQQGYKTVYVPSGTYLISKGTNENDSSARINLVSNMTLQLDAKTIFQKETNNYKSYSIIYVAPGIQNATIKGGSILGDRDTHDFSAGGIQEWGHGVLLAGGDNITVDGMKIQKMTGDGIYIGMSPVSKAWEAKYGGTPKSTIESGGVDEYGNLVDTPNKIRNIGFLDFVGVTNDKYRMVNVWIPQKLSSYHFDVYYYDKDKKFISKDNGTIQSKYSKAPKNALYYRIVFEAPSVSGVYALMYPVDIATNVVIKNNDIGYNRRQGITANGENVQILNNNIHDTKGTAPSAGIDIEPGFQSAKNHLIKGNVFTNNVIQMVASKGDGLVIDSNKFIVNNPNLGGNGVGLHVWDSYSNVRINNNSFVGRGMTTMSLGSVVSHNNLVNANVQLSGNNQSFTYGNLIDGTLQINKSASVSNTIIKSSGTQSNGGSIMVFGNIQAKNVSLIGTTRIPAILGGYADKNSTYNYLSVINGITGPTSIPSGTYTNSSFTYNGLGTLGLDIQYGEHIIIDHSTFNNVTLTMHSIRHGAEATIKNSTFTYNGELNQSAIQGTDGQSLLLLNNTFIAKKATKGTLVNIGKELEMYIANLTIDGNIFHTNSKVVAINTVGAGLDKPPYFVQNNYIYNGILSLTKKDINKNNHLLKE